MIHLFTHTDLDGAGCSVIAHMMARDRGEGIHPHYCDYTNINAEVQRLIDSINMHPDFSSIKETQFILITDISVDEKTADNLEALHNKFPSVTLAMFDHHQLKEEVLRRYWVYNDTSNTVCGTSLLYDGIQNYPFKNESVASFVNDVCLYDTWRFDKENLSNSEALNILFYLMGAEGFVNMVLAWFSEHPDVQLNAIDNETYWPFIESDVIKRNEYAGLCNGNLRHLKYKGYNVGVLFAEKYISFVGDYVLKKNPDIDFVAIVNMPKAVSLRTKRTDINLGIDIARPLGGGGHPMAAGFQLDELPVDFIKKILKWEE